MLRCPAEQQLEQFLEDLLGDAETRTVSTHVDGCERCQTVLERLTDTEADGDASVFSSSLASEQSFSGVLPPLGFLTQLRQKPPTLDALESKGTRATNDNVPTAPAPEASQIPGYEILREVGRGGMGVVYQARHISLNRLVALKMIRAGVTAGPRDQERFRHEAEAVARLHHPNIVQIYDIGESARQPYLALEYVAGGSLMNRLRGDPQPVYPAARLLETLAQAVQIAHTHGIVHRDLKPANILLASTGRKALDGDITPGGLRHPLAEYVPKIADFGLAKRLDDQTSIHETEVVGTPSYMAPEQAANKGKPIGPAADVYALGAILYEMLTGRPPFKGQTALDTALQVVHQEPVRPSHLRPKLPRDLETICLKCLEKEPNRRYASAQALAEDLRRFRHGMPIHARPITLRERAWKWARRRPGIAATLVGMCLVAIVTFVGVTRAWRDAAAARDIALDEKYEKELQKEQAEVARAAAENAQQMEAEQRRRARMSLYYSRIAQSELQWRVNDFLSAEQTLAQCLPSAGLVDRRGWEWYYLRGLYHSELFTLRHETEGISGSVAVSNDGKWIASVQGGHAPGESDRTAEARLWDARTGETIHAWALPGTFHHVAFSPDGLRLAFAGTDGSVVVWHAQSRKYLLNIKPHNDEVSGIAFSPDGRRIASAGWDQVIKIWDARTGEVLHTLSGHTGRVYRLAFNRDGQKLASGGEDSTVRIWDTHSGDNLQTLRGHKSAVYGVAYSPDGEQLVSAGSNGNLKIWELASGRVTQSLTSQVGAVLSVVFSPDGRYLAYGGGDTTVRVWDVEAGIERVTFRGHTSAVEGVQFTPDGQRLISGSAGQAAVKVWDLTRHPEFATLARTGADIEALAYRDEDGTIVSLTVTGTLQAWDSASGVLRAERTLPVSKELASPATLAAFGPQGKRVVALSQNDRCLGQVWDTQTGQEIARLSGHQFPISCFRFSNDGHIVTGSYQLGTPDKRREIKVWEAQTGEELASLEGKGAVFNVAFSPDGRYLALAGQAGDLSVVDWATKQTLFKVTAHPGDVTGLAFSSDGHRLASSGLDDPTVKVWDWQAQSAIAEAKPVLKLTGPLFLSDLAFSPDGRRVAGISRDVVKLWDAESGQEVLTLRGAPQRHYDPVFSPRVLFSPDGKRMVGTNWDESISVWEADAGSATRLERRQAARRHAADERAAFWHLQEAEHCLEHKNLPAARFHLHRLGNSPLTPPLQVRREKLVVQQE